MIQLLKIQTVGLVCLLSLTLITKSSAETNLLEGIVNYKPKENRSTVHGSLNCKGSTNVGRLLKIWIPKFQKLYPHVQSTFDFKGSGDGIQALLNEQANIGAASRPIREREITAFKELKGYTPVEIKISLDAIAVYVNRLNKLETITLEELDAIFSVERKRAYPTAIDTWSSLTGADKKINIYLFDKNSGTRSYFRHQVMHRGHYNMKNIISDEYTKTNQVINQVANDRDGICFGSAGVNNFKVKTLSVSKRKHYPTYSPTFNEIKKRTYPLTRFFYLYMDVPPDRPIPKLLYEFCKFILSKDGQKEILRAEGIPLSPQQIGIELSKMRRE
ncbi:MAG: PstS family phosphate ABC transporter substrate-binding protein [Epsilonproteobacteria bacterium]|nr:PstS family phosphate ABC transporter substrate-binding protein [Campylobacterota bacterium]